MKPAAFAATISEALDHPVALVAPTDEAFDLALAKWVVDSCLLFGATVATAYQVAGLFVEGVMRKKDEESA